MEYNTFVLHREYRMVGSCDNCRKKSSFGNRLCNKCFWILIGRKKYE